MSFSSLPPAMNTAGAKKFTSCLKERYADMVNQLQTGDLLFCSGNYPISQIIKLFSGSMFSHVGFLACWHGRPMLFESVESDGVRIVPLDHYIYNYENSGQKYDGGLYIARHTGFAVLPPRQVEKLIQQAIDLVNCKYDKDQLAAIASRIAMKVGRSSQNQEYICSEYVAECFAAGGIEIPLNKDGFWYPEDIAALPEVQPLFELVG
ncbi:YiiX/YebB-like N1pC/P60 family cysteine hydrolase [Ectobacillus ponti]|uniref:Permuted papain-like amidase enzyme, YaeF/YiiX, C92 family n=1 Tax=Ectobacillus ponti TaxID=2961894 RepID=A0AA41X6Z2_9BACI|nr:YiiX/YebB-like N1pC/P60 family cysteine hydrolase [Ectobacillus ponti]MCP8967470.1 hypothetical protein [Ectobacillus ponti]